MEAAAAARGGGHDGGRGKVAAWERTYLDVLGVCCTAEVALVERLLSPIDGVRAITVVVPSRTVIVEHDAAAVSNLHIGNVYNPLVLGRLARSNSFHKRVGVNFRSPFPDQ